MAPIHTILHPTDFSERSDAALQLACALARDYGARLVVLHVAVQPAVAYGEGYITVDSHFQDMREQLNQLSIPPTTSARNGASRPVIRPQRSCASPARSTPT
jgi:nucleotide-binding universal stress UspA family protein